MKFNWLIILISFKNRSKTNILKLNVRTDRYIKLNVLSIIKYCTQLFNIP